MARQPRDIPTWACQGMSNSLHDPGGGLFRCELLVRRVLVSFGVAAALMAGVLGCQSNTARVASAEPPAVPVSQPLQREVTDYAEFTGQTKAVHSNDIIPQVTGYLVRMPFREGAEVKRGDLLFEVDPRPYKAQLDQAQGQVDLYKAQLRLAKVNLARNRAIEAASPGSVSRQQFDQGQAVVDEASARVDAAKRSMELYQLNYEFTSVRSPIDGQSSRYFKTIGNLVNQDQSVLTTVVSVDPMHVYFEVDELTLNRYRKAVSDGKLRSAKDDERMPVYMGLQGEDGFPHAGTINFVNNQSNVTTGTTLVRGIFPNPEPKVGRRLLSPGMFARIRLPIGAPHKALLVPDRAIASDQGLKYVFVIDAENKLQSRRVTTGALQDDDLRVIEEGLKPDDWIVSGSLLQVRPRMLIRPDRVPISTLQKAPARAKTKAAKAAPAKPPVVPVSLPVRREVTDYVDFTGQTKAVQTVDIIPLVTGYLVEMPFREGAEVKKGDLLFVVDRRPYKAQLEQAQGQVNLYQAQLKLARTTLARDRAVNALAPGSISPQQIEQEQAVADEAKARVEAFEKSMEVARLNHEFTEILAPIDGQISFYRKTLGNLVNQNETRLTTVVSVDPMYVYFEMDEPTLLRYRRAVNEGKLHVPEDRSNVPVSMALQGEAGYPHEGTINFVDNQVNPTTGSILVRGAFANPELKGGHRLLSPGRFAAIRLPIGVPHEALLVIDRAISSDQGRKYVFVVGAENKVEMRRITTGALQEDGLRVVEAGLEPGDWVVSGGILQVREQMLISPERVPMPTLGEREAPSPAVPKAKAASKRENADR
jgi:multidrug efflux system membrane fusion protein